MLVVVVAVWGRWRLHDSSLLTSGEPVRVAVLQANIAQEDKWDPRARSTRSPTAT